METLIIPHCLFGEFCVYSPQSIQTFENAFFMWPKVMSNWNIDIIDLMFIVLDG